MFVPGEAWTAVQVKVKDSIFVKDLAVMIWGGDTLIECSVTGRKCPGSGVPPKKQLPPYKYAALKGKLVILLKFHQSNEYSTKLLN